MRAEVARKRKFTDLSDRIVDGVTGDPQLERMRAYLMEWAAYIRAQGPKLGATGSTLARFLKSQSPTAGELLGESGEWIVGLIDAAMDDLAAQDNGALMAAAIRCRYLKEGVEGMQLRVIRSGELTVISAMESDRLADDGERLLIPRCKKRGLLI